MNNVKLKLRRRDKARKDNTLFSHRWFPNSAGSFSSRDLEVQSQSGYVTLLIETSVAQKATWFIGEKAAVLRPWR